MPNKSKPRVIGETARINLDLPKEFFEKLTNEAQRRGITRQSLIRDWLYRAWQTERPK